MRKPKVPRIFAFGFEAMGYQVPDGDLELPDIGVVEFVPIFDERRLDDADGVICLQGLFDPRHLSMRGLTDNGDIALAQAIPERYQQTINLVKEGGWACFLVTEVVDQYGRGISGYLDVSNSDLCKRMLTLCGVQRKTHNAMTATKIKDDEFAKYVRLYGIAHTLFPYFPEPDLTPLTLTADWVTGFQSRNGLFFLPFYNTNLSQETADDIVSLVATAIHNYRMKRIATLPEWINSFAFPEERKLNAEIRQLSNQIDQRLERLDKLQSYKSILTTSNDLLKDKLIEIFEDFFEFKINPTDDGRQDFMLLDTEQSPIVVVEAKGTKGGIKRDFIHQLDSHRTTNGLDETTPGLLLVNNQMDIASIDERRKTLVDQIEYAAYHNCLILRTVDLLLLMNHLWDSDNRRGEILKLAVQGGGWLQVDDDGFRVIKQKPAPVARAGG